MGFLKYLFGVGTNTYSQKEYFLSSNKIKELVSKSKVVSLDSKEERIIEETIIKRRRNDGKISMRQIDEVLRGLRNKKKISEYDKKGTRDVFEKHFAELK